MRGGGLDLPCFHIYSPAPFGHPTCTQPLPGPKAIRGGPILYGVVRAQVGFPIQSGPPRFAPYPGSNAPWADSVLHPTPSSGWGGPREVPSPALPPLYLAPGVPVPVKAPVRRSRMAAPGGATRLSWAEQREGRASPVTHDVACHMSLTRLGSYGSSLSPKSGLVLAFELNSRVSS